MIAVYVCYFIVVVVQSLSCVQLFVTPWTAAYQASLSFTIFWSLLKLNLLWVSHAIQPSHPLSLLLLLPLIFPSIRVFSNELALCSRWPKYWSFSISPSKDYSGLISFRFDLLAVQGLSRVFSSITVWKHLFISFSSVQFSRSVVSDSLRPHEPQHARPPSPSPTPGVQPNSCPLSQWCLPTISSSVILFICL